MNTKIVSIEPSEIDEEKIKQAARILKEGGLAAFPTETVYGLGADALNALAADKIYKAKGRPSDNPLIVHIGDISAVDAIARDISESARKLMEKFWPGPLTLILKKEDIVPLKTTGGLDTVAVRMPSHPVALALIRESGLYIAAPSANTSGKPSPTTGKHVADDLEGRIDMIIDAGAVGVGLESTIVDVTTSEPVILRPGYVTKEMLEQVIGEVREDKAFTDADSRPKAPGMKYRHYAPKAELVIVDGQIDLVIKEINRIAGEKINKGIKVGIIATQESLPFYKYGKVISVGSRKNEDTIAHNLYSVLREFDETDVELIYCESFSNKNLGQAISNRLTKAASNHVIDLEKSN